MCIFHYFGNARLKKQHCNNNKVTSSDKWLEFRYRSGFITMGTLRIEASWLQTGQKCIKCTHTHTTRVSHSFWLSFSLSLFSAVFVYGFDKVIESFYAHGKKMIFLSQIIKTPENYLEKLLNDMQSANTWKSERTSKMECVLISKDNRSKSLQPYTNYGLVWPNWFSTETLRFWWRFFISMEVTPFVRNVSISMDVFDFDGYFDGNFPFWWIFRWKFSMLMDEYLHSTIERTKKPMK